MGKINVRFKYPYSTHVTSTHDRNSHRRVTVDRHCYVLFLHDSRGRLLSPPLVVVYSLVIVVAVVLLLNDGWP